MDYDFIDFLNHLTFDNEEEIEALDFDSGQDTQCFSEDAFLETASLTNMSDTSVQGCFPYYLGISPTSKDSGININSFRHFSILSPYEGRMENTENDESIGATSLECDIKKILDPLQIDKDEILKWFL